MGFIPGFYLFFVLCGDTGHAEFPLGHGQHAGAQLRLVALALTYLLLLACVFRYLPGSAKKINNRAGTARHDAVRPGAERRGGELR